MPPLQRCLDGALFILIGYFQGRSSGLDIAPENGHLSVAYIFEEQNFSLEVY